MSRLNTAYGVATFVVDTTRLLVAAPLFLNKQSVASQPASQPRPGLRGKYGKVLLTCLEVAAWVLELNTDCEFFCENLPFTDIVADWKVMCLALGHGPTCVCHHLRRS